MLKICLVFWKSEPQYAYKRYAYKKKHATGIWSEIPEIPCVEITDELLRTTGHMNNFCSREFVFYVFQPNKFK